MPGSHALVLDTTDTARRLQVERWAESSPAQKAEVIQALCRDARKLAWAGIRLRHPSETERARALRLGALTIERQLMIDALGWDPRPRGAVIARGSPRGCVARRRRAGQRGPSARALGRLGGGSDPPPAPLVGRRGRGLRPAMARRDRHPRGAARAPRDREFPRRRRRTRPLRPAQPFSTAARSPCTSRQPCWPPPSKSVTSPVRRAKRSATLEVIVSATRSSICFS